MCKTSKLPTPVVINLVKIVGLTVLLQSAAIAALGDTIPQGGSKADSTATTTADDTSTRQMLPKDGGLPGAVLHAYFAALQAHDWNALKAVTPSEIRVMMEEDERDGYHLRMLDNMKAQAPADIKILEAWVADEVAYVRYQGSGVDRQRKGLAELVLEDDEWKLTVAGLEE